MIRTEGVTKKYSQGGKEEVAVLKGVSFKIERGTFAALIGSSGSGKSTLLNILGGIDHATDGKVWIGEKEISTLPETELTIIRRETIGIVFQFFNLMPTLSVFENVALPSLLKKIPLKEYEPRVRELLQEVGLGHRLEHRPHELSGGEMQRVAIARALVNRPEVLLADEPTGNLDSVTGEMILKLLRELTHRHSVTLVMATHSPEATRFADRVITLKDGAVLSDVRQ
ncbi:MAG TPA: ABC transporter ATP-binding protein [Patescibacteria group bacterium]|nr:ABC transporter ATP-binding protein [Patescibacteria group bacterium]